MKFLEIIMIALVSSLIFIPSMSNAQLTDDREIILQKAKNAFAEGDLDLGTYFIDRLLEIDENYVEALHYKGRILITQDKFNEGHEFLDKALEIEPENIGALSFKADHLVQIEKRSEASSYYQRILEKDPQHITALGYNADILLQEGKPSEGLIIYEKILDIKQHARDPLGTLYADKILEINPNHLDALNQKGTSLVKLERSSVGHTVIYKDKLDEAISYFDIVLESDPNNSDALFNKGRSLVQNAKLFSGEEPEYKDFKAKGMLLIDKVLEIQPNHLGALSYKGDLLVGSGNFIEGLELTDRALEIDSNYTDALFVKGSALAQLGNQYDAVTYFDKALKTNPFLMLAELNLQASTNRLGYTHLDGFLDVFVRDSDGNLASHLRINDLDLLNHTLGEELIESWPVIGTINRNGTDYEIIQYEKSTTSHITRITGGATHYGIPYSFTKMSWLITTNYWMYGLDKGDELTFVYSVFREI